MLEDLIIHETWICILKLDRMHFTYPWLLIFLLATLFFMNLSTSTNRVLQETHLVEQWDHWAPNVVYQQTIWENCAPFVLNQIYLPGCQASIPVHKFTYHNDKRSEYNAVTGLSESFRKRVFVFVKVWFEKYFSGWETAAKNPRIFVGNMIWKGSDVVRVGFEAKCEWYFSEVVCLPSLNIAAAIR